MMMVLAVVVIVMMVVIGRVTVVCEACHWVWNQASASVAVAACEGTHGWDVVRVEGVHDRLLVV